MQTDKIIGLLLKNRGLTSPEAVEGFFHPPHPKDLSLKSSGLSASRVTSAVRLIRSHIQQNHPIAVYGDYDVDGICATAVIWETLHAHSPHVFPHIPHRKDEGYGLTQKGIDHCLSQGAKLIITVDNGIVAHEQIEYCRSRGCDVIVIDHHEPVDTLPKANVLLHSTATTATGLSWFFSREFQNSDQRPTIFSLPGDYLRYCSAYGVKSQSGQIRPDRVKPNPPPRPSGAFQRIRLNCGQRSTSNDKLLPRRFHHRSPLKCHGPSRTRFRQPPPAVYHRSRPGGKISCRPKRHYPLPPGSDRVRFHS